MCLDPFSLSVENKIVLSHTSKCVFYNVFFVFSVFSLCFFFSHSLLLLLLIKWHIYWYSESFIIFCSKQPTINEVGTDTTRQLEFWYVFNHIEIATMTVTCLSVPSFVAKHSVCCFSILQILQTFFCRSVVLFFFIYIATAYSFVFFSHYEMGKGNCIAVHDAHICEWRKNGAIIIMPM